MVYNASKTKHGIAQYVEIILSVSENEKTYIDTMYIRIDKSVIFEIILDS